MLNVLFLYRIAQWLYRYHIPFIPKLIQLLMFFLYACNIPYKCKIGKGTQGTHGGFAILINPDVKIGSNCRIGNSTSIVGQSPYKYPPQIGDNVYIGPNVVIQGPVIIENNVIIAPHSLVNKSIPQNAIVAGVPAKIIGWTTDLNYNIFKNESWKEDYKEYLK